MLSEEQKKKISDAALGTAISSQLSIHDQIAALRKQVAALSTSAKVPLVDEMATLETVISNEKAKRETASDTKKAKKNRPIS